KERIGPSLVTESAACGAILGGHSRQRDGWVMTADANLNLKKPSDPNKGDRPDDEGFKQSMAELSRRLGERTAHQSTVDATAAAAARRAALRAYDRARLRRLTTAFGLA